MKKAGKASRVTGKLEKRIDQTSYLTGKQLGGILKEEVWYQGQAVIKYSLAYINTRVCGVDNGRVLGYDNSHGEHHRHVMGRVEPVEFSSYEKLVDRFQAEVEEIWRQDGKKK